MNDRWTLAGLGIVVAMVVVAIGGIVMWRPPETKTLRTLAVSPVVAPTPELPTRPWRETFLDWDRLPPPSKPEPEALTRPLVDLPPISRDTSQALIEEVTSNPEVALAQRVLGLAYIQYAQLGKTKRGRMENARGEIYSVYEGYELPGGVTVRELGPLAAIVQLKEATRALRIVNRPSMFDDPDIGKRRLTPQEQALARKYYNDRFGDVMKDLSRKYKPPNGGQMPRPLTSKEQQERMADYMQDFGNRMSEEQKRAAPLYRKRDFAQEHKFKVEYWKKFFPNKPLPPLLQQGKPLESTQ